MAKRKGGDRIKKENIINASTVGMAQNNLIQQYGEASSQMVQAFKGVRYDSAGNDLGHQGRSLNGINKYKVNPEYKKQNIKQQSGFSAELIKEARDNKEAIHKGNPSRTRTTDGIGKTNDQKYDHVKLDGNGNEIHSSGSQMKFYGIDKNGKYKVIENIVKKDSWNKYEIIDIPSEQYEGALKYADDQISKLHKQAENLRKKGLIEKANDLDRKAAKYEESKKCIRKSNVSSDEAIEAKVNPKTFVGKEVLKDSHNAGVEAAKGAAVMSGAISTAQNLYAVISENKPIDEAIKDVAKTTATSGVVAYGVSASGTAIKAMMHSSKNVLIRRIGNTSAPTMLATSVVEISKSIRRYAKGDIDEVELLQELGEKGTGMVAAGFASSVGATVGGAIGSAIPIVGTAIGVVVGGFIGSIIGYSSSSMLYKGTLEALKGAKISAERRAVIEEMSKKAIEETEKYRAALIDFARTENNKRTEIFYNLFKEIEQNLLSDNIDGYIECIDKVGNQFGVKLQLNSFEEIDNFMLDHSTVFIL